MDNSRREILKQSLVTMGMLSTGLPAMHSAFAAGKGTINFGDVGVSDPGGDWSKFVNATGWNVNLVAIGNAPSQVLNVLIAGGGRKTYDLMGIVGGMQKPLVENDLVLPIDLKALAHDQFLPAC